MDQQDRVRISHGIFTDPKDREKRGRPECVPDDLVKLYDSATKLNRELCSKSQINLDQLWIVVELNEMARRIDRLEARYLHSGASTVADDRPLKRRPGRPRKHPEPVGASHV